MPHLSINVLGPLQVSIDNTPIKLLESVKVRALLAFLGVESNRSHSREALAGLLWPDFSEESARHNLRQALFNLRTALGGDTANSPYLLISRDTVQFNCESDSSLDLVEFNRYFFSCEDHPSQCPADCSTHAFNLEKMVNLYRGEFLHQLYIDDSTEFEEWILVQRESLHQRILEAHSYLANYYEQRDEYQDARRNTKRMLELDPWREEAYRQMMRVLAMSGERSAALAQYETCRQVLAEELDVEPSEETRELYERIRSGTLQPNAKQPRVISSTPAFRLPVQLTPFIGREAEIEKIGKLITNPVCRCITLVGPGGIGKTRLALQAAGEQQNGFRHGSSFIPLASVGSMSGVIPAITNALNLTFYGPGEPKVHLLNYLRDKQILLILDNVEHLLVENPDQENMSHLLIEILQNALEVKLLVTSREALNLQSEWLFEVQGLTYPESAHITGFDEYDAVALFVQRARRAYPGFSLDAENQAEVARICRLTEGMPLAIELAATWMRLLSTSEIAKEIEDSLDFLSSSMRDLPERHRSMRAVFDQSWRMLSEDEQKVLGKLSVFRGGFERQAAECVAGASLSLLSRLVNRTLLRRIAAGRYDLHELIRQYCSSKLATDPQEKTATQERHFRYYLDIAEAADRELKGRNQLEWLDRLEQNHDNLRVALEWALESDASVAGGYERALRVPAALRWFWRMRGHFHEGIAWLTESLRQCQKCASSARAGALVGISLLMNALGDLGAARAPAKESVTIYRELGDKQGLAEALIIEGLTLLWQGEAISGHALTREALDLYREVGDKWGEAHALYRLGSYLSDYGGDLTGRAMLEESEAILEGLGEKYLYNSVLISLGIIDLSHGDYAAAKLRFERGLTATKEIRHPWGIADALTNFGGLLRIQGEYTKAQACFDEALNVYHEHGRNIWEIDVLCAMAENAMVQGDKSTAKMHLNTASSILGLSENKWLQVLLLYFKGLLLYYDADFEEANEVLREAIQLAREGQFMPDLARALVTLGLVNLKLNDVDRSSELLREGLTLFWKFDHKLGVVTALEAMANLFIVQSDYDSAVKLFASANKMRYVLSAIRAPVDHNEYNSVLAIIRTQLGNEVVDKLWAQGEENTIEVVVKELLKGNNAH